MMSGDVVGMFVDVLAKTLTFSLNGKKIEGNS